MIRNDYERLIKAIASLDKAIGSLKCETDDLNEAMNALIVVMAKVREDKRKGDQDDTRGV